MNSIRYASRRIWEDMKKREFILMGMVVGNMLYIIFGGLLK